VRSGERRSGPPRPPGSSTTPSPPTPASLARTSGWPRILPRPSRFERSISPTKWAESLEATADDRDIARAKAACYDKAAKLLGRDLSISCSNAVPDDTDDEHDHPDDVDQLDQDDVDADSSSTTELEMQTCMGDLVPVDDAIDEFIDAEEWQERVLHAQEAIETKREWQALGGWEGWIEEQTGQSRLPAKNQLLDNPPPD